MNSRPQRAHTQGNNRSDCSRYPDMRVSACWRALATIESSRISFSLPSGGRRGRSPEGGIFHTHCFSWLETNTNYVNFLRQRQSHANGDVTAPKEAQIEWQKGGDATGADQFQSATAIRRIWAGSMSMLSGSRTRSISHGRSSAVRQLMMLVIGMSW